MKARKSNGGQSKGQPKEQPKEQLDVQTKEVQGNEVAVSPKPSIKKKKEKVEEQREVDNRQREVEVPKGDHFLKDLFVKSVIVAISLVFVHLAPISKGDVQKPANASFLSLYFAGGLDGVHHITQMLLASLASVIFDTSVVYYHLSNPPHPKFRLSFLRRVCIYTHLISGLTEIVSGVVAFTVVNQTIQQTATLVLCVASITHSLTAYHQTAVVFGAKGIMTPGYLYAITAHITFAFRLFHQPTSVLLLLITYLMLHIYVWCRFFVYLFRAFSAFEGYNYTVAITLSGTLLFPYAMGPIGNYAFLFIVVVYCLLEALFTDKHGKDLARKLFAEHERYALLDGKVVAEWKRQLTEKAGVDNDKQAAKDVFALYDTNKSGKLGVNEISDVVRALGLNDHTTQRVLNNADITGDGTLGFDEFYRLIWNIAYVKERLKKKPKSDRPASEKEQARIVFNMLDSDSSGVIEAGELQMLLTQWGMPEDEAGRCLIGERGIAFDAFYKKFKPIWQFALSEVFNA